MLEDHSSKKCGCTSSSVHHTLIFGKAQIPPGANHHDTVLLVVDQQVKASSTGCYCCNSKGMPKLMGTVICVNIVMVGSL